MSDTIIDQVLDCISKHEETNSLAIAKFLNVDHQKVVGAIKSIQCYPEVIECSQNSSQQLILTPEGDQIAQDGSHEAKVFHAVGADGVSHAELMSKVPNAKVGFSKAIAAKWIRIDKEESKVYRNVDSIEDIVQSNLQKIKDLNLDEVSPKQVADYKKRKLVADSKLTSYVIRKGPKFSLSLEKEETDLTPEMIANGTWRQKSFKPYSFTAQGKMPPCGHLHPLLKVRAEFRQIFLEMGFTEMPTNNFVESSFWNFDTLFQPQQHPSRDAHDTFFLSDPATSNDFPMDYLERVRKVHSFGNYGSRGHGYEWKIEEAQKNILRTHTTAVSSRMLYKLAQEKEFRPVKYFSIDRVFRNESLDATHLAEFHQIEGVVADRGLSLGHLIGVLYEFFRKLGITKLRFKPAFNPYTEPSMEVFSYHEGLKKWVEVGNSGVFRPEMLLPMGLPEDVSVIAWGLSLERPTMIKYGISNIRELIGPRVDLRMVHDSPICRLEK